MPSIFLYSLINADRLSLGDNVQSLCWVCRRIQCVLCSTRIKSGGHMCVCVCSMSWEAECSVLFTFSGSLIMSLVLCLLGAQQINLIYISNQAFVLCMYMFVVVLHSIWLQYIHEMEFIIFHCLTIHELSGRMYVTGCCWSPFIFQKGKHRCFHSPSFVSCTHDNFGKDLIKQTISWRQYWIPSVDNKL